MGEHNKNHKEMSSLFMALSFYGLLFYPLFPQPLALVSWGRTLEMSHVTAPEVCDWLVSVSAKLRQPGDTERRWGKRYSLLLTHASPLLRPKDTEQDARTTTSQIDWLKVKS